MARPSDGCFADAAYLGWRVYLPQVFLRVEGACPNRAYWVRWGVMPGGAAPAW